MGRHSAPDDDGVVMTFTPVAPSELRAGRHARPEDEETQELERPALRPPPGPNEHSLAEQHTERIAVVDASPPEEAETAPVAAVPAAPPAAAPAKPKPLAGRGYRATAADLALLRAHSALRARVIAAAVVPFVLYTAVMYVLTWLDVYFIWVWIPLVSAGVLAGSFLDAAHRRYNKPPAT